MLVLALIVIGGATLIARYRDQHATTAATPGQSPAAAPPTSVSSPSGNSIAFESSDGKGTMAILDHRWSTAGPVQATNGNYLLIELQLSVAQGSLSYGPSVFQAFDATGNIFDTTSLAVPSPALSEGELGAGQQISGWISFDIERGDTTLLLAGPDSTPVAALKITKA